MANVLGHAFEEEAGTTGRNWVLSLGAVDRVRSLSVFRRPKSMIRSGRSDLPSSRQEGMAVACRDS